MIQDGAPELWTAIKNALRNEALVPRWTEVLDWYHLDERLTKCLDAGVVADEREARRACWRTALLEKKHGVNRVIRSLRHQARDATACKSVVNVRAKRSGQRWSQRGLTAALHLRAIHESDRFDGFWSFFARRYRARHIVPLGIDSPHRACCA